MEQLVVVDMEEPANAHRLALLQRPVDVRFLPGDDRVVRVALCLRVRHAHVLWVFFAQGKHIRRILDGNKEVHGAETAVVFQPEVEPVRAASYDCHGKSVTTIRPGVRSVAFAGAFYAHLDQAIIWLFSNLSGLLKAGTGESVAHARAIHALTAQSRSSHSTSAVLEAVLAPPQRLHVPLEGVSAKRDVRGSPRQRIAPVLNRIRHSSSAPIDT
eukprot:82232-Pleurochrysis_carterae.AAC.4